MGLHLGSHEQNLLTMPQVMRGLAVVLLEQPIDGSSTTRRGTQS